MALPQYYKIEKDEIGYYAYFESEAEIFINYQLIFLNYHHQGLVDLRFLQILAHEMAHVKYRYNNTFDHIKWFLIREQNNNRYNLGDQLRQNGHCSSGPGHEMHSPENRFVCDIERSFRNPP